MKAQIIQLPKVADPRGNLTFLEGNRHLPFEIARVFYLYDVPGGESMAGHALKTCQQFVIAASGSFDVVLHDGQTETRFHLCRSYYGLYIPPLMWRVLDNFSSGSVCLVLASQPYEEEGYLRDFESFLSAIADRLPIQMRI